MSGQSSKEFWAHSGVNDGDPGLLRVHLQEVGVKAQEFAMPFGAGEMAKAAGLLHDLGKYSDKFQRRVRGENISAPHSAFGAKEASEQWPNAVGRIIAWCVAGHHSGLANHHELLSRLKASAPDASAWENDNLNLPQNPALPGFIRSNPNAFSAQFLVRMIFSCLVDADRLAAEKHFNPGLADARNNRPTIPELRGELEKRLDRFASDTEVNRLRAEVLADCREKAESKRGFFSLSVPTGGGKTLSSLAFALRHAERHKMRRVVCAIPFTSVIEQNADVFREELKELGDDAVLEHHCNYEPEGKDGDPDENRLSAENWDRPVVATTNVQLFESMFAARASRCRKLHNLAQSVIVLDEAQALPANLLRPCVRALDELVKNYGASVVFCTATLPDFNDLLKKSDSAQSVTEIIKRPKTLHKKLKRVDVQPPDSNEWTPESLADALAKTKSVLCVVNTREQALNTFDALRKTNPDGCFHLSAWMHPNHRTATLEAIKVRLREKRACRVVSTSLVEAGVDLDFPEVWRATAGLDSIAQAAGRCNREGKLEAPGRVVVFRMENDNAKGDMQRRRLAGIRMLERAAKEGKDALSPEFIRGFFARVFGDHELGGRFMEEHFEGLDDPDDWEFMFREIEGAFRMIEDGSVPIVIPVGGGKTVADNLNPVELKDKENIGRWARKARRWSASVSRRDAEKLEAQGFANRAGPDKQFLVLKNPEENYDGRVGGLGLGKLMLKSRP